MSFSKSLQSVDKREIGRYEDGRLGSFLGFSLGIIIAFFHIAGMKLYVQDLLYIWVS